MRAGSPRQRPRARLCQSGSPDLNPFVIRRAQTTDMELAGDRPPRYDKRHHPLTVGLGPSDAIRACERVSLASVRATQKTSLVLFRSVRPKTPLLMMELAGDRPPRYGGKNAAPSRRARACPSPCSGPPDIRGGNPLGCACGIRGPRATMKKTPPLHVGRGPVPRHAAVYRKLARDRPSPYGIGKAVGPSDVREGQALALRGRVTHRDREVSPTGGSRDWERAYRFFALR